MSSSHDPLLEVAGKTVVITAAASGMGLAACELFSERGADVVAVDIDSGGLKQVLKQTRGNAGEIELLQADLTDVSQIEALISDIRSKYPVVDVLYNHAGLRGPSAFDYDEKSIVSTATINLIAPMLLTQGLLPLLRTSGSPSLIYTASVAGLVAVPELMVYGATKAALINYVRSVAKALGPEGIRANAICPGGMATAGVQAQHNEEALAAMSSHIPLRRMGLPEDSAYVALFLASEASRYVTGAAIPVDGGVLA